MARVPTIELPAETSESVTTTVETPDDPTGGAVTYQLTDGFSPPAATGWTAGSWRTSYDAEATRAQADSPNIGAAETLAIVKGKTYALWIKWIAGDDTVIRKAAVIKAV